MFQFLNKVIQGKKFLFFIWILALFAFLYIANPNLYYFLNDDFIHIPLAANKKIIHGTLFRPIADISLWIDYQLWGKSAKGYHITNITIHIINSILVFFLAKLTYLHFSNNEKLVFLKSFCASLLFLFYAFHSESIFWIIGRGGSLSCMFFLASSICLFNNGKYNYFGSLLFFFMGLLVYETIWVFPIIVTIISIIYPQSKCKKKVIGLWILFMSFLALRSIAIGAMPGEYEVSSYYNLDIIHLFYNLNALFGRCFIPPSNSKFFLFTYILLISIFLFLFIYKKSRFISVLIICIIISILPVLSLGIDTHDSESERFIYFATVFVILLIIEIISGLRIKLFLIVFSFILSVHFILFIDAANSYKFASLISKKSLECIGNYSKKKIILFDVPSQYKGALIFRTGLETAVGWILKGNKDSIQIISMKEVFKEEKHFKCVILNLKSFQDFDMFKTKIPSNSGIIILNSESMMSKKVLFRF